MKIEAKKIESLGEILTRYEPIESFKKKYENETDEQFEEWLSR